eukprot:g25771.t1
MGSDNILAIVLKASELAAPETSCSSTVKTLVSTRQCGKLPKYVLYTKQDKSNLANYRPISLLSIISKVMEGVINSPIEQHLLSDAQFGFPQGHLAPDLITALVQTWTKELNSTNTEAVHVHMQQDLDNIQAWADKWQVIFVLYKCQAMTIKTFNGIAITEFPTINILGLSLTRDSSGLT